MGNYQPELIDEESKDTSITWWYLLVAVMLIGWSLNLLVLAPHLVVPEATEYKFLLSIFIALLWFPIALWFLNIAIVHKIKVTFGGLIGFVVTISIGLLLSSVSIHSTNLFSRDVAKFCKVERIEPDRRRFKCNWVSDIAWYEAKDGDLLLYQVPPPK